MTAQADPNDGALQMARSIVLDARRRGRKPVVRSFFDEETCTASHVVHDPVTRTAAIIDSLIDYDAAAGRISHRSADAIVDYVLAEELRVAWLLETHVHADHLSAARLLQQRLGGRIGIGRGITAVQSAFGAIFDERGTFRRDGSQFDRLFDDGDSFGIGMSPAAVLRVPGHTPADVAYVIGDAVFCGDTLFMPDYGTARADFPGGDARALFRSIRRLLGLPRESRLFLCHDYKSAARDSFAWETTIGAERDGNIHARDGIGEDDFVSMRTARDRTLAMPRLILPSVQVNMRGGRLPEPEPNGLRYLKIPLNQL